MLAIAGFAGGVTELVFLEVHRATSLRKIAK
jgi:hypothetical protein